MDSYRGLPRCPEIVLGCGDDGEMQWRSVGEGEHDLGEYLLSNRSVSVCDAFCFESFCDPGANNKLLWCAISEP